MKSHQHYQPVQSQLLYLAARMAEQARQEHEQFDYLSDPYALVERRGSVGARSVA